MRSNRTTTTTTLKRKKKAKAAVADAITFPGRENRNNSSQVKKLKKWAPITCYVYFVHPPRHTHSEPAALQSNL